MAERRKTVRIAGLHEVGRDKDLENSTPEERLSMVWPLTVDAWAFKGGSDAGSRLQRHTVRVRRSGRQVSSRRRLRDGRARASEGHRGHRTFGSSVKRREIRREDIEKPDVVLQIEVAPRRIDILTSIDAVEFSDAWDGREEVRVAGISYP